jgi:hypothetical protein
MSGICLALIWAFWDFRNLSVTNLGGLSLILAVWNVRNLSVTNLGSLGCYESVCH